MSLRVGAIAGPVLAALVFATAAFGWRDINILEFGFSPDAVNIQAGEDLHWTNKTGVAQSVTSDTGLFDSGSIPPGGGYSMKIQLPGMYGYHSTASPQHKGVLVVPIQTLSGPGADPVADHIPELEFPPADADDIHVHQRWGVPASTTRILLGFKPGATVEQANAALTSVKATVAGGLPDAGILLLRVSPSSGDPFENLTDALETLRLDPVVDFAAMSLAAGPQTVPRGPGDSARTKTPPWTWRTRTGDGNWGLKSARFPQAWNLLESIRRKSPRTITGIVDSGFDRKHPDLEPTLTVPEQVCLTPTDCRPLMNTPDHHGNRVAGIIGAAYDNDLDPKQDGRSLGISGGNPFARMQGFSMAGFNGGEFVLGGAGWLDDKDLELFDLVLRSRPTDLRVINYSAGASVFADEEGELFKNSNGETIWWKSFPGKTCGPGPTDDDLPAIDATKDYCTPNNQDGWLREFTHVGHAAARIAKLASQAGVMIVQSAGNDSQLFCPPAETNCTSRKIRSEVRNEFAWASANWSRGLQYDVAGLANPILIAEATWSSGGRASYSNIGGDVAAPGSGVLSTVLNNDYTSEVGTSLAAPHVTALVGYLLADDPTLSLEALRRKVIGFGSPPGRKRTVEFDWRLEDRTGRDDDGDGLVDYATTSAAVTPAAYRVDFDACEAAPGGDKPARYRWDVDSKTVGTTAECRFHWDFPAEGTYSVTLTITDEAGVSGDKTEQVKVDDLLIVSIGDSIASGEGNPDVGATGILGVGSRWESGRCHRSAKAGPAQAARLLEQADVHSSVTFLHLACSGARVQGDLDASGTPEAGFPGVGGLLTAYEGIDPPTKECENSRRIHETCLKPQLAESMEIVRGRAPDALLISIGANDMWFSEIVRDCIWPANECHTGDARRIFNDRIALLPARYAKLDQRLRLGYRDLPPDHVFITQYPDPTHNELGQIDMSCLPGMRQEEAEWAANTVVPRLNNEVAKAAARYGWTLVDGISFDFSIHGYCAEERWFVQILQSVGNQGDIYGGFHPNFRGHQQYAERIVGKIRQKLGAGAVQPTLPIRDGTPRLDAFASTLSAAGAAKRLVDVNDNSKDGNRRVIRDRASDGAITETPNEAFSKVPGELTAPDGYVDMRDFRRFRDAYLQACAASQTETYCPAAADIQLDGADTHAKKDLNFDRCVDVEPANPKNCDAKEPDFSRFDFNGDDKLTAADKDFVALKEDGKAAADRAEGARFSDLDVLQAEWSLNPKTSEGWDADDLLYLIQSGDLEVHADALFNEGARKADVQVRFASDGAPVGPERTLKRGEDFAVVTIPTDGFSGDEYEVVTTATTDKGTSQSVSEKLTLKVGEDRRVDLCPGISLKADPPRVPADGMSKSRILLTLTSCDGKREVAGKPITWKLSPGSGGASLDLTPSTTDANGKATARFTAGTAQTSYTIEATVELDEGTTEKATVVVETVPKLTIKYVWQQAYEEYTESGSTRWTGNTNPLMPDCTVPGVVDYCIDSFRVELPEPNRYGAQRDGTLTGGGATFKLTETTSRSLGVTRSSWTTSTPDGTTKNREELNQWFITDPDAYQNHDVGGLRADDRSDGVHFSNLEAVGNLPYHYALTSVPTGGDPDAVRPIELIAVRHSMLLIPQGGAKPIRFAAGPGKEIVFERRADGTLKPFQSCGRLSEDLTTQPGYYVADASEWIAGARDIFRKTDYAPGDRPMPVGPGRLRVRYAFAAVAAYPGQTVPDPQLPDCTQNHPPTADFTFTPQAPDEGRQVSFTDKSTDVENDVSKWEWSFGDGSASDTTPDPHHMFEDNGTFDVTLKVTDKDGATNSVTKQVVVKNLPPDAELEAGTAQVGQPLTIVFRLLDAGTIDKTQLAYSITSSNPVWPLMSGTREANVYTDSLTGLPAGTYPLTLTVRDKDDEVAVATDVAIVTPEPPPPPPPPPPPRFYGTCDASVQLDSEEQRFLDLVNDYREENGLRPVAVSPALNKAADAHAHDMASHNFMDHKGSDGSQPWDRARKAGYPKTAAVAENIARGTPSGRDVLWGWRSSTTGHNENMLNPAWRAVGIARESGSGDWFWATSYGDLLDCPSLPSSSSTAIAVAETEDAPARTTGSLGGVKPVRLAHSVLRGSWQAGSRDQLADRHVTSSTSLSAQVAAAAANQPPIAAFTISDATPLEAVPVSVTNVSRDASGSPIGAVLDFGDGTPTVPLAVGESVTHTYPDVGVHELLLTATDGNGQAVAVQRRLSIEAVPLRVPLMYYGGAWEGNAGEQVTLSAALRDFATPLVGKTLTFRIGDVVSSGETDAQGVAEVVMLLTQAPGHYDLVVRFDGDAAYQWQEIHVPFSVVSNAPPVASPGGPYELLEGGALTLDGSASSDPDPGDRVAAYAWDLNDDGAFGEVVGGTPDPIAWAQVQTLVCGGTCERDSPYSIALKVTDTRGASATAKTTVKVISDFTITLDPASQSLSPGSSNSFAVSLASLGGFASPVTLSVSGLPAGFTASFETNPITPPGVTALTITASQNAPEGVIPLTVVGTGGGITHQANSSVSVAFGLIPVCYGTFTGKVTDGETGEPLAGVVVGSYPTAVTDTQGLYTITQVPLGFNNASVLNYLPTRLAGYWQASRYGRAICGVVTRVDLQPIKVRYGAAAGRVLVGTPDPNDHTRNRKVTPTDTPLPDAKVTGYYPHGVSEADADGRYTRQLGLGHNNAAHGDWLRAEAPGYWWQDKFVNAEADVTKPVDFELVEQCYGTFNGGRLIDEPTGLPLDLDNVVVEVYGTDYRWTRTDNGIFVFNSRERLDYNNSPAWYTLRAAGVVVYFTIDECGAVVSKDIPIPRPSPPPVPNYGYLEGYVFDEETGQPVKGAYVHGAQTDAAGYYKTGKIFVGNDGTKSTQMYFNAWAPEYWQSDYVLVTVTADQTARKDFRILRQRRGTIEGTVRDAVTRQPIAGADVGGHSTDANGHYRIPNLGLGYRNAPQTYGYYAQKQGYWYQLKYVQVRAGETSTLDYELLKECSPARIVGVVLNASTQQPIAGASVYGGGASSTTNETGRFELAGIRLGHGNSPYDVSVTASAPGFYSQTKIVTVFCGATISLDFGREQTKLGTIVGTVTNGATGAPIANAFVGSEYGASARTDAKGDYKLVGAPLGDDNADRDWNVTVAPAGFLAQSKAVTVKADTEVRADFQFLPQANRAPVADAKTLVVDEDAVSPVRLTGSDPDDDPITFAVVTQPQHGTLSGTAPALTYTPAANYSGPDSFTYKAADGELDSEPASVSITVEPVNDQPTAADDAAATDQNIPVEIPAASLLANDSDPDGDTLAVVAAFDATHGTVALEDATVTFTPESDYAGPAGFRYRVSDGHGGQAEAAVAVTVDASNAPPVTIDDAGTVAEDGSTVIDVLANDSPGAGEVAQQLTASLLTQPAHGVAIVTPTGISYAPAPNHNGPDTFDYQACDDGTPSECAPGTVAVDVTPVNDRPQGADGTIALDEDAPPAAVDLGALASDVETNTAQLTYEIVSAPAKGVLSGDGPVVDYDSSDNANGLDSFTFRIVDRGDPDSCSAQPRCDAPLASEVHTVTIEIAPLNDMPRVTLDPAGPLPEGGSVDLIAHGADPDSDPLTFAWHANGGTLHADGDMATLSADDGPAEIPVTVTVDDGALTAKADEVVAVVNVAPQVDAGPDRAARTGEPIEIESVFTDPGADTHTAKIDWGDGTVTAGTVTGRTVGGMHAYADDGTYTVSFTVEDDDAGIGSDSFALTVAGVSPYLLVIDDESIDNGAAPNFFSGSAVNDHIAKVALRAPLPAFDGEKFGSTYTLHTGQVGDEGWFALKTIPAAWDVAGPTADGERNFVGNPRETYAHHVGPGLGTRDAKGDRESLLGKVPRVTPLRATALALLAERRATVCGVVYDGDISINYVPLNGSLKGANLGTVALRVLSARPLLGYSAGSLPQVEVEVLDARSVCERVLQLYADAPEPKSSSVPYDTGRSRPATRPPNLLSPRRARFGGLR